MAMKKITSKFCKMAIFLGVLVAIISIIPFQAFAFVIHINNPYPNVLSVAFVSYDDSAENWYCHGWHNVDPYSSKNVQIENSTGRGFVYLYSFTRDTSFGGEGYPSSVRRIIINQPFGYYDGEVCPDGSSRRQEYFGKWEIVDGYVDYTP
jgi:uncharacterized membrane protein